MTSKRPSRITNMIRRGVYDWVDTKTGDTAQSVIMYPTTRDFNWFIVPKHETYTLLMPPREFWNRYKKVETDREPELFYTYYAWIDYSIPSIDIQTPVDFIRILARHVEYRKDNIHFNQLYAMHPFAPALLRLSK